MSDTPDMTVTAADAQDDLAWAVRIPLLNNRFIWWDFVKAIGISVVGMWVVVFVVSLFVDPSDPVVLPWQLPVVCGAIVWVSFLIACVLMGNGYSARFRLDGAGVHWDSGLKEKRLNRAVVIVGALAGSAQTAGSGLLATSSESGAIAWGSVRRINLHPGPRVISVRNGWRVVVRLYVPAESWDLVVARVQAGMAG